MENAGPRPNQWSHEMSEPQESYVGCVSVILITVTIALLLMVVHDEMQVRDNYILDLQRRVGQLETRR